MNKPRLVLECAKEHGGDVEKAKEMIRKASECGGTAVKFQAYSLDDINRDHDNYKRYCKCWLNLDQLRELKEYADIYNIDFFCSVFSESLIEPLAKFTTEVKIPSTYLRNESFIRKCIDNFKTVHISTGMHHKRDIETYYRRYYNYAFKQQKDIILYHCTSMYPTMFKYARLSRINDMWTCYEGFSDHSIGNRQAVTAWLMGVGIIEKHFSLNPHAPAWCNTPEDIEVLNRTIDELMIGLKDSPLTEEEKRNYEFYFKEFCSLWRNE